MSEVIAPKTENPPSRRVFFEVASQLRHRWVLGALGDDPLRRSFLDPAREFLHELVVELLLAYLV